MNLPGICIPTSLYPPNKYAHHTLRPLLVHDFLIELGRRPQSFGLARRELHCDSLHDEKRPRRHQSDLGIATDLIVVILERLNNSNIVEFVFFVYLKMTAQRTSTHINHASRTASS